jgi:hypothetical protein
MSTPRIRHLARNRRRQLRSAAAMHRTDPEHVLTIMNPGLRREIGAVIERDLPDRR